MMTTATPHGNTTAGAMLRKALVPAGIVSVLCIAVSAAVAGRTGLWGAVFGAVLVAFFFSISLVVLGSTQRLDPIVTLMLALALYTGKLLALAVALLVVTRADLVSDPFDRTALGVTVIVCALTWTVCEVVAATKRRELLYDLGEGAA